MECFKMLLPVVGSVSSPKTRCHRTIIRSFCLVVSFVFLCHDSRRFPEVDTPAVPLYAITAPVASIHISMNPKDRLDGPHRLRSQKL
mmetsp:Transcript_31758/g.66296  ORF Transcript_31758/g.66296 Transcript_31758/m.66296 type:complete len:87 (-) Transcript_31758:454-714(-)